MATKIPTEILIKILNNVQSSHSTQDLYSSLLVNRIWCKITIPILWELTLGQECCMDDEELSKKALCIRTYISCMDTRAKTLLTQNGFDLSSSLPQATFDYPSFTHKIIIDNLVYFVSIYSQQIIGSDQDNYIITKSRILFREICKLIINRCKFLDSFKMAGVPKFSYNVLNHSDLIGSILKLPSAPKVFKKLESFTSMIEDHESIYPLYKSLALICDNILNIDLKFNTPYQIRLLARLISVQKRLENLSVVTFSNQDYDSLLWAIISQKETLKILRLKLVSYCQFEQKSSPIGQFTSLQELYIEGSHSFHDSDCLYLTSSFTKLSSFHYFRSVYPYTRYPQEFIIKILETANNNLKNIYLDIYPTITSDIFSTILNYCIKITKLTLRNLSHEQVIAIFNNNFNELRRFSFDCGGEKEFDANKLLCKMAENIPESLETIEIRMIYGAPWIFSADSLRKLFEGWCCKGGRNKKVIIKRTEQTPLFILSDEHSKVIEEYGVQFDFKLY
ncbi:8861_t:CDS:1 [Diversispora eburnea]|uniref:8861_t:CDS:1 n=1 Tax=Diversispora eburnea TaxID=1213867 RepID=A0A9N9BRF0_9GLOM|nr:8861_t:CDS:1 [Diversispora eburnea]